MVGGEQMNRSVNLIQESIKFFSEANKSFKLKKPVQGVSFTHSKKELTIPAGNYVIVDTDDRDISRYIVANKADQELYAISKELVK